MATFILKKLNFFGQKGAESCKICIILFFKEGFSFKSPFAYAKMLEGGGGNKVYTSPPRPLRPTIFIKLIKIN